MLRGDSEVQILWHVGKLYHERYQNSEAAQLPNVRLLSFVDRMDLAYAVADLVVCRAGALTISELSLLGKAALLVPSPNVAEDHQRKNAEALVRQGAAKMVLDKDAAEQLVPTVVALLGHAEEQAELGKAILAHAKPEATTAIVSAIVDLLQQRSA